MGDADGNIQMIFRWEEACPLTWQIGQLTTTLSPVGGATSGLLAAVFMVAIVPYQSSFLLFPPGQALLHVTCAVSLLPAEPACRAVLIFPEKNCSAVT